MDTFLFPMTIKDLSINPLAFLTTWGAISYLFGGLVPISFMIRFLSEKITSSEIRGYSAPFYSLASRSGTCAMPHLYQFSNVTTRFELWNRLKRSSFRRKLELVCPPLAIALDDDHRAERRAADARSILSRISKPVLLLYGKHDEITKDLLTKFVQWIPDSPHIYKPGGLVVERSGHLIAEDRPDVVSQEIIEFCRISGAH